MRILFIIIIVASLIGLSFITKNKPVGKPNSINSLTGTYAPVVILELFTSEGCSSCPPADDLLPELAKENANIIPLSFHVDYWNRLGWEDPFSNSEYSERQRAYGEQFHLESVYTPQLVVNGEFELVGSNRTGAESAIKKALQEKMLLQLSIEDVKIIGEKMYFTINTNGNIKNTNLLAAIVQKQAVMKVKAGENRGATLSHINVVRSLVKQAAGQKTAFELTIPKYLGNNNGTGEKQAWEIIVYSQQQNDLKITGAVLYKPQ